MTMKKILEVIEAMDAPEADAMGVSCREFAAILVDDLEKAAAEQAADNGQFGVGA